MIAFKLPADIARGGIIMHAGHAVVDISSTASVCVCVCVLITQRTHVKIEFCNVSLTGKRRTAAPARQSWRLSCRRRLEHPQHTKMYLHSRTHTHTDNHKISHRLVDILVSVLWEGLVAGRWVSAVCQSPPACHIQIRVPCLIRFFFRARRMNERGGGLRPSLSALEFRQLLFNLTALKISNAGGHNCECRGADDPPPARRSATLSVCLSVCLSALPALVPSAYSTVPRVRALTAPIDRLYPPSKHLSLSNSWSTVSISVSLLCLSSIKISVTHYLFTRCIFHHATLSIFLFASAFPYFKNQGYNISLHRQWNESVLLSPEGKIKEEDFRQVTLGAFCIGSW